jgi:hypothetical protein
MPKITIIFEVDDTAPNLPECTCVGESLHEALCQGIHEGAEAALDWLEDNVIDITRTAAE